MNTTEIKYSIIIPTFSRVKEFQSTLATVLLETFPSLEIIVQDNASEWGLVSYINNLHDKRIRVNRSEIRLSMADNWTSAIDFSLGEYIFILGDDDGWYPGSLEVIDRAINNSNTPDAIYWKRDDFGWPDAPPCISNTYLSSYSTTFGYISANELLYAFIKGDLNHEMIPKIYNGFQHKRLLLKYKELYSSYFLDPMNPDISTGIQAMHCAESIFYFAGSMSIIGTSGGSNGASSTVIPPTKFSLIEKGLEIDAELFNFEYWNPDLGILNSIILFCNKFKYPIHHNALQKYLYGYLLNLPKHIRPVAWEQIILQYSNRLELNQLLEIIDNNEFTEQPVNIINNDEFFIASNLEYSMKTSTKRLGITDILRVSLYGSALRKFYNSNL